MFFKKDDMLAIDRETVIAAKKKANTYLEAAKKAKNKGLAKIQLSKAKELTDLINIIERRTKI